MKKKFVSVLLATAMIFAYLPAMAFAETDESVEPQAKVTAVEEGAEIDEATPVRVTAGAITFTDTAATVPVEWTVADAPEGTKYAIFVDGEKVADTSNTSATVTVNRGLRTISVAGYTGEGTVTADDAASVKVFASEVKVVAGDTKYEANVSWDGDESAVYTVFVNEEARGEHVKGTSYSLDGLEVGTKTTIAVECGDCMSPSATYLCRPDNVEGFKSYSSYKRIVLEWNKVEDATGYSVYRSTKKTFDCNNDTLVKSISSASTLTYTDNVDEDKHYYYRVFAVNNGVMSLSPAEIDDEAFRPIHYKFTFKTKKVLTSHTGGKVKHTFKAGTTWTATGFNRGKYIFYYGGRQYQVLAISTKNRKVSQCTKDFNYTATEATYYVNQRGLTSKTNYLVLESLYTQHEYVFKGSKGKWELVYQDEISSGKASTPSSTGVTKVSRKVRKRHGLPYWSYLNVFSLHGKHKSWTLGYPKSGGCIRHANDYAKKIYYDCKIGTAVCVQ